VIAMERYAVNRVPDLVYAIRSGKPLYMDLYLPQDAPGPLPVILWLHGGGWRIGDRRLGPDLTRFFAEKGFAMASIDYRLSGEAVFPAQIHDVKAAIRWLKAHADSYGLDAGRIGLWGSSAGGHLAALAGTTGGSVLEEESGPSSDGGLWTSDVQAVVDGYGPTDFLQMDAHRLHPDEAASDAESSRMRAKPTRSADADSPESQLMGAPIETCPDRVREANPITYVRKGLPPFLILHGTKDVPVPAHQSVILYEALRDSGNEATLVLIEGFGHAFFNQNDLDDREEAPEATVYTANQRTEQITRENIRVFALIEQFFRTHLMEA